MSARGPKAPDGLPDHLKALWREYWKSPDLNWHPVLDLQLVTRLFFGYARAIDAMSAIDTFTKISAELRLLEDRLGLNPKARSGGTSGAVPNGSLEDL